MDLRKYAQQTTIRLIIGGLILIFVLGDGLIYLIYGPGPAAMGLLCLAGGLMPIGLILLIFWGIDWFLKHANRE